MHSKRCGMRHDACHKALMASIKSSMKTLCNLTIEWWNEDYESPCMQAKSRMYRGMFEVNSPEKKIQVLEKDWSQQVEHMQSQMGRDQVSGGVSVPCQHAILVANVLWKPLISRSKVELDKKITNWYKVWSVEGRHYIWSGYNVSLSIRERGTSYCMIRYRIDQQLQWRFQAFLDVSLFEKFIWKSCSP